MITSARLTFWCSFSPLIKAIIGWLLFILFYFVLRNNQELNCYSAYFPLIGETSLDALSALLAFKLKAQFKDKTHQNLFLILSISFMASLSSDFIYNICLNIFDFNFNNTTVILLFELPFALFLLLQLTAMIYIVLLNENKKKAIYTPNIILSLLMFIIFMFGTDWKISYVSPAGIFQFIDTILEAAGFSLATICLARAKGQIIHFITIGYLIIVSSDFIIRHHVISGSIPYLSPFEATWTLGLLIICLGFYGNLRERNTKLLSLMPANSLQAQLTVLPLILWIGSIILFIVWNYLFAQHESYIKITRGFLSSLVRVSVLGIIASNFLSTKISSTLFKLERSLNHFIETDTMNISSLENQVENINQIYVANEKFGIYEVDNLCKFIMNTVNELQLANRIKADFLMQMSHDFRTPASGIYSMSKLVYKKIDDPNLKSLQKLIVQSSEQLLNLLEDLLDYSRLDSNQYKITIKAIDLQSVINEVILLISAKAQEKGLVISCYNPNFPVNYNSDRLIIHRILLNIVSNAIKFTNNGGINIYLNLEKLEHKKWIVIKIQDTGIGIDKKYHQLVFQPFFRIESSETSKSPGIGLGLSNALSMLRKVGGQLVLDSNINQGSTFTVLLPV